VELAIGETHFQHEGIHLREVQFPKRASFEIRVSERGVVNMCLIQLTVCEAAVQKDIASQVGPGKITFNEMTLLVLRFWKSISVKGDALEFFIGDQIHELQIEWIAV
jgi:hypothetical protein